MCTDSVYKELEAVNQSLNEIGTSQHYNSFITLSFLALPVIPELKATDQGLFHVGTSNIFLWKPSTDSDERKIIRYTFLHEVERISFFI